MHYSNVNRGKRKMQDQEGLPYLGTGLFMASAFTAIKQAIDKQAQIESYFP
jgi:hypothetical protein